MKVGFVVHFFDFRNDVRKVIELANREHEVVLFIRRADAAVIEKHLPAGVEVRIVDEEKPTRRNAAAVQAMRFFGRLPKSARNYYLMEMFKINAIPEAGRRRRAVSALNAAMRMPRFIGYDTFLSWLDYKGATPIADVDLFICFTEISDHYFFARLLAEGRNLKVYVYSWDHACKQVRFSRRASYLVWNEGIKQDLVALQGVPARQIAITGASQFAFIDQFYRLPPPELRPSFAFDYVYFGCAIGIPALAAEEVRIVRRLAVIMLEAGSPCKLVVRPYPNMSNWQLYQSLSDLPNVVLDDQFRSADLSISEGHIMEKFIKIHFARLFVHLGTTLGLEACFTDTPAAILDFDYFRTGQPLSIYNFVHQYQNEKYLLLDGYQNVVRSEDAFRTLVQQLDRRPELLRYNQAVRSTTPVKSFEDFTDSLIQ